MRTALYVPPPPTAYETISLVLDFVVPVGLLLYALRKLESRLKVFEYRLGKLENGGGRGGGGTTGKR